jgi:small subunit ribosomal protein S8
MSMNDPIADFLTRLRNAQLAKKKTVSSPSSTVKVAIAAVLKEEGYIGEYSVATDGAKKVLNVVLKYYQGKPVIERIERISKPSLRVYKAKGEMPKILGGLGIAIVSTPQGVISDRKARASGLGGEVLCVVA